MHANTPVTPVHNMNAFVNLLIQYCLKKHFKSKRHMARAIGVGYRTVLHVTNEPDRYKGASLVFQELIIYCINNRISVDDIAQVYYEKQKNEAPDKKHLLESNMECGYRQVLMKLAFTGKKEGTRYATMCRFLLWMHPIFCEVCKQDWPAREQKSVLFGRFLRVSSTN